MEDSLLSTNKHFIVITYLLINVSTRMPMKWRVTYAKILKSERCYKILLPNSYERLVLKCDIISQVRIC